MSIKQGICTECGSKDIYHSRGWYNNKVVMFKSPGLDIYVCGTCGYLAEFIRGDNDLTHVRNHWTALNKRKNEEA